MKNKWAPESKAKVYPSTASFFFFFTYSKSPLTRILYMCLLKVFIYIYIYQHGYWKVKRKIKYFIVEREDRCNAPHCNEQRITWGQFVAINLNLAYVSLDL